MSYHITYIVITYLIEGVIVGIGKNIDCRFSNVVNVIQ